MTDFDKIKTAVTTNDRERQNSLRNNLNVLIIENINLSNKMRFYELFSISIEKISRKSYVKIYCRGNQIKRNQD